MAAKTDNGILLSKVGINITEPSRKNPWMIAEAFVLPPD